MNERIILIMSWLFGILIIFAGLIAFSTSLIGGIFSILAGILLLPIFQNKIDSVLNKKIMKRWFVIVALLLMVIGGSFIGKAEERALKDGTASQELKDREVNQIKLENKQNELEAKKVEEQLAKDIEDIEKRTIEIVKANLHNPESAKFRNMNGVCGELSAIDVSGKQSEFIRFVLDTKKRVINYDYDIPVESERDLEFDAHFEKLRKKNCVLR